jgi:Bacteriophage protein of unknown function (DUF646).
MDDGFAGLERLQKLLTEKAEAASMERIVAAQQKAAAYLQDIMRGRSSPRKSGKMLSSFEYKSDTTKGETDFGWGKFYGRLKESGHKAGGFARKKKSSVTRVKAQPHLRPTFEANKSAIMQMMADDLN